MMPLNSLPASWFIAESMDTYEVPGKLAIPVGFGSGQRGYVKRCDTNPDYLAVLMRTVSGRIYGWWIKASECEELLIALKPAPDQNHPERRWRDFWTQHFMS